jgi:hypothetical protein
MDTSGNASFPPLLPEPKTVHTTGGRCSMDAGFRLDLRSEEARLGRACERFTRPDGAEPGATRLLVAIDPGAAAQANRQAYRLTIVAAAVEILGASAAGCFLGLKTLEQLIRLSPASLPCGVIEDWPDFATRGLLIDVSRGRVPTVESLEATINRLADWKLNQVQLYIEHTFAFDFDPDIAGPDEALTPDEIRRLDSYARDRFIDLVPALATPGHMGRILAMPKYRHLAEIEADTPWSQWSWPKRARGLTLDCMNPDAHALARRIWRDVLAAFSSPVVNICGDEPWDMGQGKNRDRITAGSLGEAYVGHVRGIQAVCIEAGRRTQIWGDIIRKYPDQWGSLDRDTIVLHWGYDDDANYDGTGPLVDAGLETFVCPGTSGWKRIMPAAGLAERNIDRFARTGLAHGATGLINTDWGDHGHFSPPACSLHGIALGAAKAWSANHPIGDTFDQRFAMHGLGSADTIGVAHFRNATAIADRCETWRTFWMPAGKVRDDPTLPGVEALSESRREAEALSQWCAEQSEHAGEHRWALNELEVAAGIHELACQRLERLRERRESCDNDWAARLDHLAARYAALWLTRHKPLRLDDVMRVLAQHSAETRTRKRGHSTF